MSDVLTDDAVNTACPACGDPGPHPVVDRDPRRSEVLLECGAGRGCDPFPLVREV